MWPAGAPRPTAPLPDRTHRPGLDPRPDEAALARLHALAGPVPVPVADAGWRANTPWLYGLRLLEEGFHWEAHEVLEPVWLGAPPNAAERHLVQGVIQIANGRLKERMGRPRAAARLGLLADGLFRRAWPRPGQPLMGLERAAALAAAAELQALAPTTVSGDDAI